MSDHEAVYCDPNLSSEFLFSDPYPNTIQENWESLKQAINNAITANIPQTMSRATRELPWINQDIKRQMRQHKKLHNKAKHLQTEESWQDYCKIKNNVTRLIH